MNYMYDDILSIANEAAIYDLYLYLAHIITPHENATFQSVVSDLEFNLKNGGDYTWNGRDVYRLSILINALKHSPALGNSKLSNLTASRSGLTACSFTNQNRKIFVVFKGTGKGEWIDNGEGLSGITEENTYITYGKDGIELSRKTVKNDYATEQQAEALNWFNMIAAKDGWTKEKEIIISGHSKGGNKAQFITVHSDLVNSCYSFDGQGFSPEAVAYFEMQYGAEFEARRQKIHSFSTDNDYINVLGERLVPQNNIYYFESYLGFHYLEAMLNANGIFNRLCEQGKLSRYAETVSERLMSISPHIRKYATLGVMNIFHKFLGEGATVNGDNVSVEQTIVGVGIAVDLLLRQLNESKKENQNK